MRALLIYPSFPDTFWSLRGALQLVGKRAAMPPLGLLTVAALLPGDWSLRLIDTNLIPLTRADLAWADVALVSAMGVQRSGAREAIARCRAAGLRVVAGGPLFTAEPEAFPEVDHLVLNEAELTLPRFLDDLQAGSPKRIYTSDDHADLRRSPIPRFDLLDMKRYYSMGVQYSRGCPFNCEFCNVTALFGRTPRVKRPEQMMAELDALEAAGWHEGVFFVDDNLIGNRKAARELFEALVQRRRRSPSRMSFNTQASINLADDPSLLSLMAEAGFDTVFVGLETPNTDSLAESGKVQNCRRDLVENVKTIQRAGIEVQGGFIVGFDSDDESIFQRQIDFIQQSGVATAMVGMLHALPGTALFRRLRGEGRLRGDSSGDNVDGTTNIVPAMGAQRLREGYYHLLRSVYSPRAYYQRVRTFLKEYRVPRVRGRVGRAQIATLLRTFVYLGVLGRERVQFWYLLLWTLVHRPRGFRQAVTLSVYGAHFIRICRQTLSRTARA